MTRVETLAVTLGLLILVTQPTASQAPSPEETAAAQRIVAMVNDGSAALRGGRVDDGRRIIGQAAAFAGADRRRLRILASALLDASQPELAIQVAQQASRVAPDDALLSGVLGLARHQLRRYAEAVTALTEAVRLAPREPKWLISLARSHIYTNEETLALEEIQRALKLAPDSLDALAVRAECEYRNARYEACEATAREVVGRDARSRLCWQLLVRAQRTRGRTDAAIESAASALKAIGDDGELLVEYGVALLDAGRLDEAAKRLEAAQVMLPKEPRIPMHLAKVYTRQGAKDKAAEARKVWLKLANEAKASESRPG